MCGICGCIEIGASRVVRLRFLERLRFSTLHARWDWGTEAKRKRGIGSSVGVGSRDRGSTVRAGSRGRRRLHSQSGAEAALSGQAAWAALSEQAAGAALSEQTGG